MSSTFSLKTASYEALYWFCLCRNEQYADEYRGITDVSFPYFERYGLNKHSGIASSQLMDASTIEELVSFRSSARIDSPEYKRANKEVRDCLIGILSFVKTWKIPPSSPRLRSFPPEFIRLENLDIPTAFLLAAGIDIETYDADLPPTLRTGKRRKNLSGKGRFKEKEIDGIRRALWVYSAWEQGGNFLKDEKKKSKWPKEFFAKYRKLKNSKIVATVYSYLDKDLKRAHGLVMNPLPIFIDWVSHGSKTAIPVD